MKSVCPNCCGMRVEFFDSDDDHEDQNCIPCRLCGGEGTIPLADGERSSDIYEKWEKTHFVHCILLT